MYFMFNHTIQIVLLDDWYEYSMHVDLWLSGCIRTCRLDFVPQCSKYERHNLSLIKVSAYISSF